MSGGARGAHAGEAALRALARGEGAEGEAAEHVAACERCRRELALLRALARIMAREAPAGACPPAELLVRADAGVRLDPGEQRELRRHLTECLDCAAELEALARMRDPRAGAAEVPARAGETGIPEGLGPRLRELVAYSMPLSLAVTTRSRSQGAGREAFREAMEHYRAERYAEAIEGLRRCLEEGGARAEVSFYLGVCLLREGRSGDAVEQLEQAVRRPPRLGEYHWFLAQAYLEEGRGEEALRHLEQTTELPGPYRDRAKELSRRVEKLRTEEERS